MKYQRQPSGSLFCPRLHMLSRKKPTSQRMKAIYKEVKRSLEYMPPIMLNRNNNVDRRDYRNYNFGRRDDVENKLVHEKDRRHKVIAPKTRRNPLEDRNIMLPNTLSASDKKLAPFGKSTKLAPSPNAMKRSTSSRLNIGSIPLSKDITKPKRRFRDGFSSEKLVRPAPLRSKDDSNGTSTISKKSHPSQVVHNSINMSTHMGKNVDALASVSKDRANPDQEEEIVVRKNNKRLQSFKRNQAVTTSEGSKFSMERELLVPSKDGLNEDKKCWGEVMVDKNKEIQVHESVASIERTTSGDFGCDDHRKKEDVLKAKEAPNSSLELKGNRVKQDRRHNSENNSFPIFGKDLSSRQRVKVSSMGNNMEQNIDPQAEDGRIDDGKFKSKRNELPEEMPKTDDYYDSLEAENCRPMNKWKISIENDDVDGGEQNHVGVEDGTDGVMTETAIMKDHSTKVSTPSVSKSVELKHYSSLPIDEPIWSGIFKIGSKGYVSLAAHLSTKSCEKVWKLSRSLPPVVQVTKLSRLEAWPKSFVASRPTDDSIGLYFLPHEMRPDEDLDQQVKEVVENDMVLRAVVGEAEMLISPSILLPEQYQTFQGKHYLWGVFKRREDKVAVVEKRQHGTGHCAQEEGMGKQQHTSRRGMRKEGTGQEPMAPSLARSRASTRPAERAGETSAPTTAAAMSANHARISSSLGTPQGRMFGFVVRQTPRIEQLIEKIEREGAMVFAMRGEMIGSGLGQAIAAAEYEENSARPSP